MDIEVVCSPNQKQTSACFSVPQIMLPFVQSDVLPMEDVDVDPMDNDDASSGDESESSDEILSTNEDDDGVDYVKMWEENAVEQTIFQIQEFDESKILEEIKFLAFDEDKRIFSKVEKEILQKLGVEEEIKNLIFSGKLVQKILEKRPQDTNFESSHNKNLKLKSRARSDNQNDTPMKDISTVATKLQRKDISTEAIKFKQKDISDETPKFQQKDISKTPIEKMDVSSSDNLKTTVDNSSGSMVKVTFGGQQVQPETFEMSPEPEDDSSIRDILADIQVSFFHLILYSRLTVLYKHAGLHHIIWLSSLPLH